jgi:hypothetical protein
MASGDKAFWSDIANAIRPPMVRLVQQALQSIPNAIATAITFGAGSEDIDTHGFHDTAVNPSRITPNVAGWYDVRGTVFFASAAHNDVSLQAFICKNNVIVPPGNRIRWNATTATQKSVEAYALVSMNGTTDYVEIQTTQNTGAALNTQVGGGLNSALECRYASPL